ncbi:MAG TPA: type VII secretion protein EssC, partial [Bacilli bacterium]|nr:type VII secretion protein EssC [Bacilli bacterium]
TNDNNKRDWEKVKNIPFCWDDNKTIRYYGSNIDEISQISNVLEEEYHRRRDTAKDKVAYQNFTPYYVIFVDDVSASRSIGIINELLKAGGNYGFSIIMNTSKLNLLPNECSSFINVDRSSGGIFENELVANKKSSFIPDFPTFYLDTCYKMVSNIPIDIAQGSFIMPKVLTFLEMYNVGNVEQLNSFNKWKANDPTASLQAPVGINENGELFKLDLHEKAHGPHGLIAGMTGSGKSEFIISYILSMAVNYHPYEVNFVLIDYKGGGLAGAFENKETGVKLPHLAGTITNLDINDINRSLASLESELKRRQRVFNEARDMLAESTIDIYKYQKLYREGLVKEPVSHLFIISDEFAELKVQQPEFMSQLISTARIGRSLGVHLILATQKPSGVVDDQIWSNSKFRVCLKVQEKNDSMDMIKVADAANLKEVGRFYLQVGYNEFFALGQSAWCGAPYYETDKRKKKVDTTINFVDNLGYPIKSIESTKKAAVGQSKGEELTNILKYLVDIAHKENVTINKLWLDKIPEFIYINELKQKYSYLPQRYNINPVIGEYDVPTEQRQGLLTLPLTTDGNALVYGVVGSGKDLFLNTLFYSAIIDHPVSELNIYAIDMGAETLKVYRRAPHVGDIIISGEDEKINNLLKYLAGEIKRRKKLFQDYGGEYSSYCKISGRKEPTIIVALNQIEVFQELYPDHEETIIQLTRDSSKYGVIFVVTVSGVNNVRYKLAQNFKTKIALQLGDKYDYNAVVGNVGTILPAKYVGRGLVNIGEVYEFQTAYPYKKDLITEYVGKICTELAKGAKEFAPKVPILPELVDFAFLKNKLTGLNCVPVGVEKESLDIKTFDFSAKGVLIGAQDLTLTTKFIESISFTIATLEKTKVIIIDGEQSLNEKIENCLVFKQNYDEAINKVNENVDKAINLTNSNPNNQEIIKGLGRVVIVLNGVGSIKDQLTETAVKTFEALFDKVKNLAIFTFVLVDSIDKIKKYEYDLWYKAIVNGNDGIWIGNGVSEQFSIKIAKQSSALYEEIAGNFGYSITKGVPVLVKLIESYETSEEDDFDVL